MYARSRKHGRGGWLPPPRSLFMDERGISPCSKKRDHGVEMGTGMPIDARENARPKSTPDVRLIYPLRVWNRWQERSGVHRSRYTRTRPTEMPEKQAMDESGEQQTWPGSINTVDRLHFRSPCLSPSSMCPLSIPRWSCVSEGSLCLIARWSTGSHWSPRRQVTAKLRWCASGWLCVANSRIFRWWPGFLWMEAITIPCASGAI